MRRVLGLGDLVLIAAASIAPAFSLATTFGPMVEGWQRDSARAVSRHRDHGLRRGGYRRMGARHPNAGSAYSWVRIAFGPPAGAYAAWILIVANVFAIAATSMPAGAYTLALIAPALAVSPQADAFVGTVWVLGCGALLYAGLRPSARAREHAADPRADRADRRAAIAAFAHPVVAHAVRGRRCRARAAGRRDGDRDLDDRWLGSLGHDGGRSARRPARAGPRRARRPARHRGRAVRMHDRVSCASERSPVSTPTRAMRWRTSAKRSAAAPGASRSRSPCSCRSPPRCRRRWCTSRAASSRWGATACSPAARPAGRALQPRVAIALLTAVGMAFTLGSALSPNLRDAFAFILGGTSVFLGVLFMLSSAAAVRIFAGDPGARRRRRASGTRRRAAGDRAIGRALASERAGAAVHRRRRRAGSALRLVGTEGARLRRGPRRPRIQGPASACACARYPGDRARSSRLILPP